VTFRGNPGCLARETELIGKDGASVAFSLGAPRIDRKPG